MNIWSLVLGCGLGLLVGGALGGLGISYYQQIRSGRVKVPPTVAIGPIKIDLSGLGPKGEGAALQPETGSIAPLLEGGSSATGGCLGILGAGMVFLGFVLPWFSCSVPMTGIQGSMSGLGALLQILGAMVMSLISAIGLGGLLGGEGGASVAAMGLLVVLLLLVVAVFLALTPLMGFRIGRTALSLIQTLKPTNVRRRQIARSLTVAAIVGLVPMVCSLSGSATTFGIGVRVQNLSTGLWVTMAGFGLALIAGTIISTAAALSDQLPKPPAPNKPG